MVFDYYISKSFYNQLAFPLCNQCNCPPFFLNGFLHRKSNPLEWKKELQAA